MLEGYTETWLHRINPSLKLIGLLVIYLLLLFGMELRELVVFSLFPVYLYVTSTGHSWKRIGLFAIPFALIFVSSSTTMILFGQGDTLWWGWGLIRMTEEGFFRGLHIGLRALIFAILGLVFVLTTHRTSLFYSLMQQCRLSPKYAYSFMAAFRLLPMMWEELGIIRQAHEVRGMPRGRGIRGMLDEVKRYSVPLLAQSIRRAARIAVAMEAKRFDATMRRTYFYSYGYSFWDLVFIAFWIAAAGVAYYGGTWLSIAYF